MRYYWNEQCELLQNNMPFYYLCENVHLFLFLFTYRRRYPAGLPVKVNGAYLEVEGFGITFFFLL